MCENKANMWEGGDGGRGGGSWLCGSSSREEQGAPNACVEFRTKVWCISVSSVEECCVSVGFFGPAIRTSWC